jgi:hypothetical protein
VTVLRAFFVAGCPDQGLSPWGSFEGWSRLVRGALVWAGEPDPYAGRKELVETGDRDVDVLERLLVGWEEFGGPKTTAEALASLKSAPALHGVLRDALCDLCRVTADKLTARGVGNRLTKFKRRAVGDRYLDCLPKIGTGVPWVVSRVSNRDSGASGDSPKHPSHASVEREQVREGSGKQSHPSHLSHREGVAEDADRQEGGLL